MTLGRDSLTRITTLQLSNTPAAVQNAVVRARERAGNPFITNNRRASEFYEINRDRDHGEDGSAGVRSERRLHRGVNLQDEKRLSYSTVDQVLGCRSIS